MGKKNLQGVSHSRGFFTLNHKISCHMPKSHLGWPVSLAYPLKFKLFIHIILGTRGQDRWWCKREHPIDTLALPRTVQLDMLGFGHLGSKQFQPQVTAARNPPLQAKRLQLTTYIMYRSKRHWHLVLIITVARNMLRRKSGQSQNTGNDLSRNSGVSFIWGSL